MSRRKPPGFWLTPAVSFAAGPVLAMAAGLLVALILRTLRG